MQNQQFFKEFQKVFQKGFQSKTPGSGSGLGLIIAGGAVVYGINASLYNVDGGHRAIKFSRIGG